MFPIMVSILVAGEYLVICESAVVDAALAIYLANVFGIAPKFVDYCKNLLKYEKYLREFMHNLERVMSDKKKAGAKEAVVAALSFNELKAQIPVFPTDKFGLPSDANKFIALIKEMAVMGADVDKYPEMVLPMLKLTFAGGEDFRPRVLI